MKIRLLQVAEEAVARQVLSVQLPAYRIEAERIGFVGIPQLKDTVETLQRYPEAFYGAYRDEQLVGVIGLEWVMEAGRPVLDIARLVVHPDCFRQGIGRALLLHAETLALQADVPAQAMIVATGAKNEPAVKLYLRFGFAQTETREVEPGFYMSFFRKPLDAVIR